MNFFPLLVLLGQTKITLVPHNSTINRKGPNLIISFTRHYLNIDTHGPRWSDQEEKIVLTTLKFTFDPANYFEILKLPFTLINKNYNFCIPEKLKF